MVQAPAFKQQKNMVPLKKEPSNKSIISSDKTIVPLDKTIVQSDKTIVPSDKAIFPISDMMSISRSLRTLEGSRANCEDDLPLQTNLNYSSHKIISTSSENHLHPLYSQNSSACTYNNGFYIFTWIWDPIYSTWNIHIQYIPIYSYWKIFEHHYYPIPMDYSESIPGKNATYKNENYLQSTHSSSKRVNFSQRPKKEVLTNNLQLVCPFCSSSALNGGKANTEDKLLHQPNCSYSFQKILSGSLQHNFHPLFGQQCFVYADVTYYLEPWIYDPVYLCLKKVKKVSEENIQSEQGLSVVSSLYRGQANTEYDVPHNFVHRNETYYLEPWINNPKLSFCMNVIKDSKLTCYASECPYFGNECEENYNVHPLYVPQQGSLFDSNENYLQQSLSECSYWIGDTSEDSPPVLTEVYSNAYENSPDYNEKDLQPLLTSLPKYETWSVDDGVPEVLNYGDNMIYDNASDYSEDSIESLLSPPTLEYTEIYKSQLQAFNFRNGSAEYYSINYSKTYCVSNGNTKTFFTDHHCIIT